MSKRMKPTTTTTTVINHHNHQDEGFVKHHHHHHRKQEDNNQQPLINGLPDHISHLILSRLPPQLLFSISLSWRRFIYSPLYPAFPSLYALLSPTHSTSTTSSTIEFAAFDFISSKWSPLPPSPSAPLRLLLRHPSYISRDFPVQSLSVSGRLVLIAATITPPPFSITDNDHTHPLPHPLIFNPLSHSWSLGPPLPAPRRWCAAGTLSGSIFVASGIGSRFNSEVARTFEKLDLLTPTNQRWEKLGQLKDGRFSREAIEPVGCRGKLYMVNVKGDAAKEGAVYDTLTKEWSDMPAAMISGWRGPAAAMDEEEIYVVDERKGVLRRYDFERGEWVELVMDHKLCGAQQMTATKGRVYVVGKEGNVVAVDMVEEDDDDDDDDDGSSVKQVWSLETPPGYSALAVHVLPRMAIGR